MLQKLRRWGITNPWVWVFFITCALQVFRGSPIDTMIFGTSTLLVWLDAAGFVKQSLRARPQLLPWRSDVGNPAGRALARLVSRPRA
jgi:hypothetical protein